MGIESRFEEPKLTSVEKITAMVESLVDLRKHSSIIAETKINDNILSYRIHVHEIEDIIQSGRLIKDLKEALSHEYGYIDWEEEGRIIHTFDDDTYDFLVDIDIAGLPN